MARKNRSRNTDLPHPAEASGPPSTGSALLSKRADALRRADADLWTLAQAEARGEPIDAARFGEAFDVLGLPPEEAHAKWASLVEAARAAMTGADAAALIVQRRTAWADALKARRDAKEKIEIWSRELKGLARASHAARARATGTGMAFQTAVRFVNAAIDALPEAARTEALAARDSLVNAADALGRALEGKPASMSEADARKACDSAEAKLSRILCGPKPGKASAGR